MDISLAAIKTTLWRNATAALFSGLTALCIAGIVYVDRADPLEFIKGEIFPDPVVAGKGVTLRWETIWFRACEGEVSREVIGADKVIKPYLKRPLRVPTRLGGQTSDTEFVTAEGLPPGVAIYRATVVFRNCGFTSRIVPLMVNTPEIDFTIVR